MVSQSLFCPASPTLAATNDQSAVVCNELDGDSWTAEPMGDAKPFCSVPCIENIDCRVVDAGRATTAARTYFKPMKLCVNGTDRYFEDGGIHYNNPSFAICDHCYQIDVTQRRQGRAGNPGQTQFVHPGFEQPGVRFVNIGTGTRSQGEARRKRTKIYQTMCPEFVLNGFRIKDLLVRFASDAEGPAAFMRAIVRMTHEAVLYERFSATGGVHLAKLDSYKEMESLVDITKRWLEVPEINQRLKSVARDIASDLRRATPVETTHERTIR